MPEMWILAGNNGAGKTTLARNAFGELVPKDAIWLNPDHLADEFVERYTDLNIEGGRFYANLASAALSDVRMDNFIEHAHGSFVVETVLSSGKFIQSMSKVEPRGRIAKAKDNGFQITMVYVLLNLRTQPLTASSKAHR
jgi:predicted ABC-type ATPase